MKIPVKFLNFNPNSPSRGYWDMYLLEKIFQSDDFEIVEKPDLEMIVVIPARHNYEYIQKINEYINSLNKVLLIIAGDEEAKFELDKIKHPNMKIWLMTPHAGKDYPNVDRFLGEYITPHTEALPEEAPEKTLSWMFSGQVTHSRRLQCVEQLRRMDGGYLKETTGFTQGISPAMYIDVMAKARVIPCPSGPATPDTFRLYEALESGCIPIADKYSANNSNGGYWEMLFDEYPFPVIGDWKELPDTIRFFNDIFDQKSNEVFAWWQMEKRKLKYDLIKEFKSINKGITVVIPTSPTNSNPDTSIIEETIKTVRKHLPTSDIIVTFDGVREEQEDKRTAYNEYIKRVLWKMNRQWSNIYPLTFKEHMHQVGMMRETFKHIHTDLILYVEQDTPLTPDHGIDWQSCKKMIRSGTADLIRFHFEAFIPKEHEYLMLDKEPQTLFNSDFVRTLQWSQRPHLASKTFYERILLDNFSPEAKTFIEDKMHSVVVEAWKRKQLAGWNEYKLWIYHPERNIKRSYHLDGRAGEDKYSMKF